MKKNHTLFQEEEAVMKLRNNLCINYNLDDSVAQQIALDFFEIIYAIDGDIPRLSKYYLQ